MLRNLLTSILLLVAFNFASAQKLSLKELIAKSNCKDFECYKTYMTGKNFCFHDSDLNNQNGKYYYFESCNIITDGPKNIRYDLRNWSFIAIGKTGTIVTSITTPSSSYYQILSTELKALGFAQVGQPETEGTTITRDYSSKLYPKVSITLMIETAKKEAAQWKMWYFAVAKDK
jgi:hypothetical protein